MTHSVVMSFANFLQKQSFSTTMWDKGYGPDEVNKVCGEMTRFMQAELGIPGEFIVLWAESDGIIFYGDSELAYAVDERAYLLPNPYIEGDSEGFVSALLKITSGLQAELYDVPMKHRVLFNAI